MNMDDLSYLEQLLGGSAEVAEESGGGVWVVLLEGAPDCGAPDSGAHQMIGTARVVANALGAHVCVLLAGPAAAGDAPAAISAGADQVLLASGMPSTSELAEFLREKSPRAILFPRTALGRVLGPGVAQLLGGSLCGYAASLTVDPIYQRLQAHQPLLEDAARQVVTLLDSPAVVVVDTALLPPCQDEPLRSGQTEVTGITWADPAEYERAEYGAPPLTLHTARIVVGGGRELRNESGFSLVERLATALGGVVAGDLGALDAGWIGEEQLIGLSGHTVAPDVYLALGLEGTTEHLAALAQAGCVIAVQDDPTAPIIQFADWNIIAEPRAFVETLLAKLEA